MIELKEGMEICAECFSGTLQEFVITRTTKTQAIAKANSGGEFRFNKVISEAMPFHEKGAFGYDKPKFYISTPELQQKIYFQKLIRAFRKIDPEKLDIIELSDIISIANK